MTLTRRFLGLFLATALLLGPATPALAQDNAAVAENTTDGSSVFELAFDIRETMQPVVEETNTAIAYSSCDSCRTVAIAIQHRAGDGRRDLRHAPERRHRRQRAVHGV